MAISRNKATPAPAWLNLSVTTKAGVKTLGGAPLKADTAIADALIAKHQALGDEKFAQWLLPLLTVRLTVIAEESDSADLFD